MNSAGNTVAWLRVNTLLVGILFVAVVVFETRHHDSDRAQQAWRSANEVHTEAIEKAIELAASERKLQEDRYGSLMSRLAGIESRLERGRK